jgi:uncharacterized MAPEG superfamily protein
MNDTVELSDSQRRTMRIVSAYPLVPLIVGIALNLFAFGVTPLIVALPSTACVTALIIAGVLLAVSHTWLMTSTELTRVRFKLYATPEEWATSGTSPRDVSEVAARELERCHNAHRNTTENTVYFTLLAVAFVLISPTTLAAQTWLIGFGLARLGYTYSYLAGNDNVRSVFMTLTLLATYGIASYLVMSLIV